jgi:hypothetical protein
MRSNAANLQQAYRTMKIGFIQQENRRHHLVRSNRPQASNRWMNALLILALKKLSWKYDAPFSTGAISGKTFICLPFAGGMSAFAVILPKPWE